MLKVLLLLRLIILSRSVRSVIVSNLLSLINLSVTVVLMTLPLVSILEYTVSFLVRAFTGTVVNNDKHNTEIVPSFFKLCLLILNILLFKCSFFY